MEETRIILATHLV